MSPSPAIAKPATHLRCMRCRARKFRTAPDLALHILVKHGRLLVPCTAADDARSVTISSPARQSDVDELDALLASHASETRRKLPRVSRRPRLSQPQTQTRPTLPTEQASTQPQPQPQPQPPAQRAWSWTTSSTGADNTESLLLKGRRPAQPADGESVGPTACDVFVRRCRDGQVSLVPKRGEATQLLNFASGLF